MELGQVSKMLAYSFVSELIKKKKVKKRSVLESSSELREEEAEDALVDVAHMSFGDLENYYKNVLSVIEGTPEIRTSLVNSIKRVTEEGKDLNDYYPSKLVADEESLRKILFLGNPENADQEDDANYYD